MRLSRDDFPQPLRPTRAYIFPDRSLRLAFWRSVLVPMAPLVASDTYSRLTSVRMISRGWIVFRDAPLPPLPLPPLKLYNGRMSCYIMLVQNCILLVLVLFKNKLACKRETTRRTNEENTHACTSSQSQ